MGSPCRSRTILALRGVMSRALPERGRARPGCPGQAHICGRARTTTLRNCLDAGRAFYSATVRSRLDMWSHPREMRRCSRRCGQWSFAIA